MLTIFRRKLRGLVAVEAVMAAFVFSLLGVSLMELFQASTLTVKHAQLHMLARQVAEVEGTTLSLIPFAELDAKGVHPRKALPNADGWESAVAMSPVQTKGKVNYRIAHLTLYRGSKATKPVDVIDWPLVEDTTGQNSAKARLIAAKTRLEALIAKVGAESEKKVDEVQKRVKEYEPVITTYDGVDVVPGEAWECPCTGDDGDIDHACAECRKRGMLCQYSWDEISRIAGANRAIAKGWKPGLIKCVHLKGKISDGLTLDGVWRATILGINHNADVEGSKLIHWIVGRDSTGADIAFWGVRFDDGSGIGWGGSEMRNSTMPLFKATFPQHLQRVITKVTKWTAKDCSSGSDVIQPTLDELFCVSEFEIYTKARSVNPYEGLYCTQYDYYKGKSGAEKRRKPHDGSPDEYPDGWWERSPYQGSNAIWCHVWWETANARTSSNTSMSVAPCFVVGQ